GGAFVEVRGRGPALFVVNRHGDAAAAIAEGAQLLDALLVLEAGAATDGGWHRRWGIGGDGAGLVPGDERFAQGVAGELLREGKRKKAQDRGGDVEDAGAGDHRAPPHARTIDEDHAVRAVPERSEPHVRPP